MVFAIHSHKSAMGVHVFPILNLPPHPIPLGHPSAPALSTLSHTSNLDWWFISHMIIYMFQCHSLKSSHPRLLPQSQNVCSWHLCVSCCLTYRVIVTNFLNSIYVCYYTILVFFFLTYFTLYNRLLDIHTKGTRIERDTCTSVFIEALFTIARTWKQPRCPLADEWVRKLWYIYTVDYYSASKKNEFESVLLRWMKLEPIIQSEVSQKEKHQYSILTHIYGI